MDPIVLIAIGITLAISVHYAAALAAILILLANAFLAPLYSPLKVDEASSHAQRWRRINNTFGWLLALVLFAVLSATVFSIFM